MSSNNQSQLPETSNDYLGSSQTGLERMGGYPKYSLEGLGDLSERAVRKKAIAEKIQAKHQCSNLSIAILRSQIEMIDCNQKEGECLAPLPFV